MYEYILGLWLLVIAALLEKEGIYSVSIFAGICAVYVLGKKLQEIL